MNKTIELRGGKGGGGKGGSSRPPNGRVHLGGCPLRRSFWQPSRSRSRTGRRGSMTSTTTRPRPRTRARSAYTKQTSPFIAYVDRVRYGGRKHPADGAYQINGSWRHE